MSRKDEADHLLDHNYDGIQEYDNPMPRWWLWIFYATVLYAALYWLNVPGIGIGAGRVAGYERDMAVAHAKYGHQRPAGAGLTDDALRAMAKDPVQREAGRALFVANCSPCHREDGGGNIGPNLTDEYWIHGGRPTQLLATVSDGVADKGMPAWSQILKPEQLPAVVAYVLTLAGTHPHDPKAPQGVKLEPAAAP